MGVVIVFSVLGAGCGAFDGTSSSSVGRPGTSQTPIGSRHTSAVKPGHVNPRTGKVVLPRHVPVVGEIRATLPADDDLTAFKSIYLAAYERACADVTSVEAWPRFFGAHRMLIVIRCGHPPDTPLFSAVRVNFINVRVPNLLGPVEPHPHGVTNRLGLHLRVIKATGPTFTRVVRQHPRPASVVPFGTMVTVVYGG
jgi:hypothetical protein